MKNKSISVAIAALSLLGASPAKALNLPIDELVGSAYQIMGNTQIPILAPSQIKTKEHRYWNVFKTNVGYGFGFGFTRDCNGAGACNWGSFSAEKGGQMPAFENNSSTTSERVTLARGKKALYRIDRAAYINASVYWQENGILYTAYIKNGRKEDLIAMANSAINFRRSNPTASVGFNAEIVDAPTNCRSKPELNASVEKVFQLGEVFVDRSKPKVDEKGNSWYRELYSGCWIPQSQFKFKQVSMENKSITVRGKLIGGGGGDDMRIIVQSPTGSDIEAYCTTQCGDWFVDHPNGSSLKESLKGRTVTLEYAAEPNGDRVAGSHADSPFFFVKSVDLAFLSEVSSPVPPKVKLDWAKFQAALKADDLKTLNTMVKFPLLSNDLCGVIKSAAAFADCYKTIFPNETKQCIAMSELSPGYGENKQIYYGISWNSGPGCNNFPIVYGFEFNGSRLLFTSVRYYPG
jgi:hypothetical protein